MVNESELHKAEMNSFKLYALLKAASFSSDELETVDVKALFELAYDLSVPVSCYLQTQVEALSK